MVGMGFENRVSIYLNIEGKETELIYENYESIYLITKYESDDNAKDQYNERFIRIKSLLVHF